MGEMNFSPAGLQLKEFAVLIGCGMSNAADDGAGDIIYMPQVPQCGRDADID